MPLYLQSVANQGTCPNSLLFHYFHFKLAFEFIKELGSVSSSGNLICRNPTLKEYEDDTHTLEMWTWESSETLENSKFDCRGQNTLH
jgi:hypothetical protein